MIDLFPLFKPVLHSIDAEKAHNITIQSLKLGLNGLIGKRSNPDSLKTTVFGLTFPNPIGLAAGFDKNAEVIQAAHSLGFGFAEAGTVTPKPQDGNEKPRLFRLTQDQAVINRFGFNNKGLEYFAGRLKKLHATDTPYGANVGANKVSEDKTADYVTGIKRLYGLASYFTVNISSPNTPGLRALQSKTALEDLINRVETARQEKIAEGMPYMPILIKIAPDLTEEDITDITSLTMESNIDGLIVSNTTITRPAHLTHSEKDQMGGLSGAPLMDLATKTLAKVYRATEGKVPLIGVGGIANGQDAYRKIRAGASLIQLYSALVYEGPGLIERIKTDLVDLLKKDGFSSIEEAVGADHR